MKLYALLFITLSAIAGCSSSNDDNQTLGDGNSDEDVQFVWNDRSRVMNLYSLEPAEFDVVNDETIQPDVIIHSENITSELDGLLRNLAVTPRGDGPFPECTPAPGQENIYLIIEMSDGAIRRFAETNGCSLGYGFPDQPGFFQQPIAGLISTEQLCEVVSDIGVSSSTCIE